MQISPHLQEVVCMLIIWRYRSIKTREEGHAPDRIAASGTTHSYYHRRLNWRIDSSLTAAPRGVAGVDLRAFPGEIGRTRGGYRHASGIVGLPVRSRDRSINGRWRSGGRAGVPGRRRSRDRAAGVSADHAVLGQAVRLGARAVGRRELPYGPRIGGHHAIRFERDGPICRWQHGHGRSVGGR